MKAVDRRLLRTTGAARRHLAVTVVAGAAAAVLVVAGAAILARVVADVFQRDADLSDVAPLLVALAVIALARGALSWASEVSAARGAASVMSSLRRQLVEHVLRRRPSGLGGERRGELASVAVQGVDHLETYYAKYLPQVALAAFVPFIVLVWVMPVDLTSGLTLLITLPLIPLFMILIGFTAGARARRRAKALGVLAAHYLDVVRGLPTLRSHARAGAQAETIARVSDRYRAETMGTLRIAFLSALFLELFAMLGTALIAVTIGVRLVEGGMAFEAGLAVLILAPEAYGPLRALGAQYHASADGTAAAERIFEVLDAPATVTSAAPDRGVRVPSPAEAPIELHGIGVSYPDRPQPALADVDLVLKPGERVALVGPSGSGKTTLTMVLMRLLDPSAGRVSCGGVDLLDVPVEGWRRQVAWLPQRPTILADTVAANLLIAKPDASRTELYDALSAASADELVASLPHGLETTVGDGGRPLSSGERQRMALARAFLRDATFVVLDEPTANLDPETAAQVDEALERLTVGVTTVAIVHRPSLARRAERLLTLDGGRIVRDERRLPIGGSAAQAALAAAASR